MDNRYIKQLNLVGHNGQHALASANVLCIGAGGLGCLVSTFLAAAGVGHIGIIDQDIVSIENLNNQIIYAEQDIGKYKVDILQKHLSKLNSSIKITSYPYNIDSTNAKALIHNYDLIVDCSDNFITRYLVSDVCNSTHKNLVSASVQGFSGQVITFIAPQACYRCLFPQAKNITNANNNDVIASSLGIVASTQANEVIKIITHLKQNNNQSHIINIDSVHNKLTSYNIMADADCVNTHHDIHHQHHDIHAHNSSTYIKYSDIKNLINDSNHKNNSVVVINMLKYEDEIKLNNSFNSVSNSSVKVIGYDNNIQPLANIQKNQQFINVEDNIVIVCSFGARSKILGQMFCNIGYKHVFYTRYAEML
ncbi:MAG: molybdopterin-synthase adenylyltransferase MoeB [Pseudomonadota bacterium]|jgi:adenylyltransferase/sulfurtransferase